MIRVLRNEGIDTLKGIMVFMSCWKNTTEGAIGGYLVNGV